MCYYTYNIYTHNIHITRNVYITNLLHDITQSTYLSTTTTLNTAAHFESLEDSKGCNNIAWCNQAEWQFVTFVGLQWSREFLFEWLGSTQQVPQRGAFYLRESEMDGMWLTFQTDWILLDFGIVSTQCRQEKIWEDLIGSFNFSLHSAWISLEAGDFRCASPGNEASTQSEEFYSKCYWWSLDHLMALHPLRMLKAP